MAGLESGEKGLLLAAGQHAEGLTACREALTILLEQSAGSLPSLWMRDQVAVCLSRLGAVQRGAGRPAEAVVSLRRAIAMTEQLPELTPRHHSTLACCRAEFAGLAGVAGWA